MEQAGVYKIDLYEGKGINILYNNLVYVESVINSGLVYEIVNNDNIAFSVNRIRTNNNKLGYSYNLDYYIYNLTSESLDKIESLKSSIYGWYIKLHFYDGSIRFVNKLMVFQPQENERNNYFKINLQSRVTNESKLLVFEQIEGEGIGYWIIEDTFVVQ